MSISVLAGINIMTGCMAERLKEEILEKKKAVDLVCGPDAYKDLPRLLSQSNNTGQTAGIATSPSIYLVT